MAFNQRNTFGENRKFYVFIFVTCLVLQLVNAGDDVLLFYNDSKGFENLVSLMVSERERCNENSDLKYHINLVKLLALCTEGKNVYTEIKCHSLLPLEDIVRVVTDNQCLPQVCMLVAVIVLLLNM